MTEGPVAVKEEPKVEETKPDTSRAEYVDRNKRYHGQLDALNPEVLATKKFLVIGAGAIGSFFVSMLTKMGAKDVTVVDDDTIEEHNISNQMYPTYTVGMSKVDALVETVKSYSDAEIKTVCAKWKPDAPIEGPFDYVVSAVDSLEVRKMLWAYYGKQKKCTWFLDGRMALEVLRVFLANPADPKHVKYYEDSLKGKPVEARCTAKTIMYTVNIVAGIMNALVKSSMNGEKSPIEVVYSTRDHLNTVTYR